MGEVPSEGQLERMSEDEKVEGMKVMLEKDPPAERSADRTRAEQEKMIMMMEAGTAERIGEFLPKAHASMGMARLIKNGERWSLVLDEAFSVDAGPQLFVYLSGNTNPSNSTELHAGGALELGRLKSTTGVQVYELPAGTDVSGFRSAVIYCKPFRVVFSVASFQ